MRKLRFTKATTATTKVEVMVDDVVKETHFINGNHNYSVLNGAIVVHNCYPRIEFKATEAYDHNGTDTSEQYAAKMNTAKLFSEQV